MTQHEVTERFARAITELARKAADYDVDAASLIIYPFLLEFAAQFARAEPDPTVQETFEQILDAFRGRT
jgi:hypothetical protein